MKDVYSVPKKRQPPPRPPPPSLAYSVNRSENLEVSISDLLDSFETKKSSFAASKSQSMDKPESPKSTAAISTSFSLQALSLRDELDNNFDERKSLEALRPMFITLSGQASSSITSNSSQSIAVPTSSSFESSLPSPSPPLRRPSLSQSPPLRKASPSATPSDGVEDILSSLDSFTASDNHQMRLQKPRLTPRESVAKAVIYDNLNHRKLEYDREPTYKNAPPRNRSTSATLTESSPSSPPENNIIYQAPSDSKNADKLKLVAPSHSVLEGFFVFSFVLFLLFILPKPAFLTGFTVGVVGTGGLAATLIYVLAGQGIFDTPDRKSSIAFPQPENIDVPPTDAMYKSGYMNEMSDYSSERFHISQLHTVFIRLEGHKLRLQTPKREMSKKASYLDEISGDMQIFVNQRFFNMAGAKVELVPHGIIDKRQFSRKYPIKITFPVRDDVSSLEKDFFGESLLLNEEMTPSNTSIFLFGRTSREKEDWYYRLCIATGQIDKYCRGYKRIHSNDDVEYLRGFVKTKSKGDIPIEVAFENPSWHTSYQYHVFMQNLVSSSYALLKGSAIVEDFVDDTNLAWFNAILGRILWDVFRQPKFVEVIAKKIQGKLNTIKIPQFIDDITLKGVDMGSATPHLLSAAAPYVNDRGVWCEVELEYEGGATFTIMTRCNLERLVASEDNGITMGRGGAMLTHSNSFSNDKQASPLYHSDIEDSAESSEDEDPIKIPFIEENIENSSTRRRVLNVVDKVVRSRPLQSLKEKPFVKSLIADFSNTNIFLMLEVCHIKGRLIINIPPPPSNRIWWGFKENTKMELSVKPKLGERQVNTKFVCDLIGKKLVNEIKKVLFYPNMDDFFIPFMTGFPST